MGSLPHRVCYLRGGTKEAAIVVDKKTRRELVVAIRDRYGGYEVGETADAR